MSRLPLPIRCFAVIVMGALTTEARDPAGTPARAGSITLSQAFIQEADDAAPSGPRYLLSGGDLAASLETGRIRWLVRGASDRDGGPVGRVELQPVGAREGVAPIGARRLPGVVNRFHGAPHEWSTGRSTWRALRYEGLWPGVDLELEASGQTLKATYTLEPGVDPAVVRWSHRGAADLRVDDLGRLVVETVGGAMVDAAPEAWQTVGGERRAVTVAWVVSRDPDGGFEVGYAVGAFDGSLPLVIDPAVVVQTGFLGGTQQDELTCVTTDASGNVYVGGWARSDENSFPASVGPNLTYTPTFAPWGDAVVAKLDPTGTALIYAGYIGGWEFDFVNAIAVDTQGRAYVAGHTRSRESNGFPVLNGPDLTFNSGIEGWVARVKADGSALEYCGYVGGFGNEDRIFAIQADSSGRAYLAGRAQSDQSTFPATVGPDLTHNGGTDAFVARLAGDGLSFDYCGYIGGSGFEDASALTIDDLGNAWITGYTLSDETTFPVSGGLDQTYNGGQDAFVAQVKPDGTGLVWCGYLGGSDADSGNALVHDGAGGLVVAGSTQSSDFPVLIGPGLAPTGTLDAFVTRLAADGSGTAWSGVIAGSSTDWATGVALDDEGAAWVVGFTFTAETDPVPLPLTGGPDATYNGAGDGFVARVLPSGASLDVCGYVGGAQEDVLSGVVMVPSALQPSGVTEAWAVGHTLSTEASLPAVWGFDPTHNGQEDGLVLRLQYGPEAWVDLGHGLSGTLGQPVCTGAGILGPYSPLSLTLDQAAPNRTAYLCVGVATLFLPFKGGVLVPDVNPPGFYVPIPTGPLGQVVLAGTMPPGFPTGLVTSYQWWISDPGGPAGFAASNAVQATGP